MIRTKSEDAVSPVIGVMLLLVVTIVIAAVVAVFASGVGADAEPAPTTVMDIVEVYDEGYGTLPDSTAFNHAKYDADVAAGLVKFDSDDLAMDLDGNYLFEHVYDDMFGFWMDLTNKPTEYGQKYLGIEGVTKDTTITLNHIAGDILDLKKLSVKVHNLDGGLLAEIPQNSQSGSISPGDSKTFILNEVGHNVVRAGFKAEVSVYYGEHLLVSEELKIGGEEF